MNKPGNLEEALIQLKEYVDDPGNWSAYDGRRRVIADMISQVEEYLPG